VKFYDTDAVFVYIFGILKETLWGLNYEIPLQKRPLNK
jgi:hypothetical protein